MGFFSVLRRRIYPSDLITKGNWRCSAQPGHRRYDSKQCLSSGRSLLPATVYPQFEDSVASEQHDIEIET